MNWLKFTILALILAVAGSACAETVIVTPVELNGWVYESYPESSTSDKAEIKNVAPVGGPVGHGAFYGATGQSGGGTGAPGQVWLGTDQFLGVKLADITTLSYWTYTFQQGPSGIGQIDGNVWQPFMLQIMVNRDPVNNPADVRMFMFRPWSFYSSLNQASPSSTTKALKGSAAGNPYGQWIQHNALAADGVWYDINGEKWIQDPDTGAYSIDDPFAAGNWEHFFGPDGLYPNAEITIAPNPWPVEEDGKKMDLYSTKTGCGFNFQVGARKLQSKVFYTPPNGSAVAWYRESFNFAGYLDNFTIGINGNSTTYDFEGPVPVGTYAIGNKAASSVAMNSAKQWHRFVICGKIVDLLDEHNFLVDDGSGTAVKVHAQNYDVFNCKLGNYVRALGTIDNTATPAILNSTSTAIKPLYEVEEF